MLPRRFQFTIRFLIKITAVCAVVFALLRSPIAPLFVLVLAILPGFVIGRRRGGTGISGGVLAGLISFVGCGLAYCIYGYVFAGLSTPLALLCVILLAIVGPLWGFYVSIVCCVIIRQTRFVYQEPLTDAACGPIVWRGLDDDRKPLSL